jgi:hypothetical protein
VAGQANRLMRGRLAAASALRPWVPRSDEDFFLKATYIWQMATKWGRYFLFFISFISFYFCPKPIMAFLCVSQQGEFKNTTKNFFGEVHVKNFWPKKLRKKNFFPVVFSHRFFLSRFWPFLCMRNPKTP